MNGRQGGAQGRGAGYGVLRPALGQLARAGLGWRTDLGGWAFAPGDAPFAAALPKAVNLAIHSGTAQDLIQMLSAPSYRPQQITIGEAGDPYAAGAAQQDVMSQVLNVLESFGQPITICTSSVQILRDIDVLSMMALRGLVRVTIPIPSLDYAFGADPPAQRLMLIAALCRAGLPVRVLAGPMISGLTDPELLLILAAARGAGASSAGFRALRGAGPALQDWLARYAPQRAAIVMTRLRAMQTAKEGGLWAEVMAGQFRFAAQRTGLARAAAPLRFDLFQRPLRPFC